MVYTFQVTTFFSIRCMLVTLRAEPSSFFFWVTRKKRRLCLKVAATNFWTSQPCFSHQTGDELACCTKCMAVRFGYKTVFKLLATTSCSLQASSPGRKRKESLQLQCTPLWNLNSTSSSLVALCRLSCQIPANQREAETSVNVNKHWKTRTKGNDVITNIISANQHFASTYMLKFQRRSWKLFFLALPPSSTARAPWKASPQATYSTCPAKILIDSCSLSGVCQTGASERKALLAE